MDEPNGNAIPWRVTQAEQDIKVIEAAQAFTANEQHEDRVRIERLEADDKERRDQLSKLLWAVVSLAFTVAGAAIIFALTNGAA